VADRSSSAGPAGPESPPSGDGRTLRGLARLLLIAALAVHLGPAGMPSLEVSSTGWTCGTRGVVLEGRASCGPHEPPVPALSPVEDIPAFPDPHRRNGGTAHRPLVQYSAAAGETREVKAPTLGFRASGAGLLGLPTHPANAPPLRS
jgi:hypothetical protein